jgi:excisionase family DNA binding protein
VSENLFPYETEDPRFPFEIDEITREEITRDLIPREDYLLTMTEVGRVLGMSPQTVRKLIDEGTIPAVDLGSPRRLRIRVGDVDQIIRGKADP